MTKLQAAQITTLALCVSLGSPFSADARQSVVENFDRIAEPYPTSQDGDAATHTDETQLSVAKNFAEQVCYDCSCNTSDACCGCNPNACCYDDCGCALPELLLGCFCPTPCCCDDWISPMTNPAYFEDPRTLTELRGIFLQHKVPGNLGGGDIQVYAVQIRAALSDRLSIVAAKDGYLVSSNPVIGDGWADIELGLKYNLIRDCYSETLLSAGFSYEMPTGTPRAFQGRGDGEFHLYLTGGKELCCDWHYLSAFGLRLPANDRESETSLYWSNHIDYHMGYGLYPLAEFNWFHWTESGENGIPGISGGDLFNFGSTGIAGNDIVTGAFGLKYKPNRLTELGIAWENPLTQRRDVLENRLTVDMILRY